jgi:elongation factor Tu
MPVEDVFTITGRGTVATGRIERGVIEVPGNPVEIIGCAKEKAALTSTVTGVEMFRKILTAVKQAIMQVLLLRGIDKDDYQTWYGYLQTRFCNAHTNFKAEVYVLSKEEGGRHKPFFNNYRPQFYFRTTDVTGESYLPAGVEMVMPGDNVSLSK